jgi:hypothetical protein
MHENQCPIPLAMEAEGDVGLRYQPCAGQLGNSGGAAQSDSVSCICKLSITVPKRPEGPHSGLTGPLRPVRAD